MSLSCLIINTHTFLTDGCRTLSLTALPFSAVQVMLSYRSGLQEPRRTPPPANEEQPPSWSSSSDVCQRWQASCSQISPQDRRAGELISLAYESRVNAVFRFGSENIKNKTEKITIKLYFNSYGSSMVLCSKKTLHFIGLVYLTTGK